MKTFKKIRKNANNKINDLLMDSVGIIRKKSKMQIDDSFESSYEVAEASDVLSWLHEDLNYCDATLYMLDNVFIVSGPYYFCEKFEIYFDKEEFQQELKRYDLV